MQSLEGLYSGSFSKFATNVKTCSIGRLITILHSTVSIVSPLYSITGVLPVGLLRPTGGTAFAGNPENVMGALIFAPSSMPTPKRPVNSPPSQPVPPNRAAPRNDRMYATTDGLPGAFKRKSQLTRNNARTTPLVVPCHTPTCLAWVPAGMPVQSIVPTPAASSPLIPPAIIIQKAISDQNPLPVTQWRMSKMTEVVSNPIGKLTSMRCKGCPMDLILLYIVFSFTYSKSALL